MIPVDSSNSSRGKRRSRRPSVGSEENKMLYATASKRTSRRPSVAESELILSLQEGMRGLEQELDEDDLQRFTQHVDVGIEAQGRLQVRLGALNPLKLISGVELHDTTTALGLTSYTIEDMNQMLNTLADFIALTISLDERTAFDAQRTHWWFSDPGYCHALAFCSTLCYCGLGHVSLGSRSTNTRLGFRIALLQPAHIHVHHFPVLGGAM